MLQKISSLFIENRFIVVFIIFSQFSFCIFEDKDILANKAALCGVSCRGGELSSFLDSYFINLYLSKTNILGFSELESNTLYLKFNKHFGSLGIFYNSFGYELYKENFFILNLSGVIKSKISVNTNIKLLNIYVKNYKDKFYSTLDLGVLANISYFLDSGFLIKNIVVLSSNEHIDKQLIFVNKFNFFKISTSYIDVVKSTEDFIFLRLAEELKFPIKRYDFFFRLGLETATLYKLPKYSFGIGITFKNPNFDIVLDYSFVYTPILAQQQIFSLGINFLKLKNVKECYLLINLNTASEEQLKEIPGIGAKIAKRIVEYREKYGDFNSIYELIYIPGMTTKKIEEIKKYIYVEEKLEFKKE